MSDRTILYLSRKNVEEIDIPITDIIEVLNKVFVEKGLGRTEMPPKPEISPEDKCFIHAMPAYISDPGIAGIKWVSIYPENFKVGLPYITGLLILNDVNTGLPISVMDCSWITAKRTGAATAVAARYLAKKNSSTVGIVACGVQGRSNLEALSCVFDIKKVSAYDLYPEIAEKYAAEMSKKLDIEIEPVKTIKEAVSGHDIVVTSGPIVKKTTPIIEPDWLSEGAFACPLDYDSQWQTAALEQADKLLTDDQNQFESYKRKGDFFQQTPDLYGDLGHIATGKKVGRESEKERIICMNLGLALEDIATAHIIYNAALKREIGVKLDI